LRKNCGDFSSNRKIDGRIKEESEMSSNNVQPKPSKAYKGMAMEGPIARWYAQNTRRGREFDVLAKRVSGIVPAGGRVLEVAPGPGFLSVEIAKTGKYQVAGVDVSKTFVEIERANAKDAGVEIDFRQGDAAALPFEDASFDFVICTAAFKNFTRPARALGEMYRVLRPQGKALVIDLRHDASRAEIDREVDGMGLNRINRFLTRSTFSLMLLRTAYTEQQMRKFLSEAGIPKSRIQLSGIGFEVWMEK
jgi:ubiquinone/menaquinone biosynthesis C-methylase UbiE